MGLYSGEGEEASIRALQCKARILAFFMSGEIWNMFKLISKDTRISQVNDKVKNKDTVEVVLASLLLALNLLHFLFCCYIDFDQLIAEWR